MVQRLFQGIFAVIGGVVGYYAFSGVKILADKLGWNLFDNMTQGQNAVFSIAFISIFFIAFMMIAPALSSLGSRLAREGNELDIQHLTVAEVVLPVTGAVLGIALGFLLSQIYKLIKIPALAIILTVLTYLILAYLGAAIGRSRAKNVTIPIMWQRRQPSERSRAKIRNPKILDTSVIIDGRILDIMETGFLEGQVVIADFVLLELQHISDSSDSLKRARGRRGLDILQQIQDEYGIELYDTAGDKTLEEIPEVDSKLLKLAQRMGGKILTNDFNLNKVAAVQGVEVLNINDLANAVKPVVLPGERMNLRLVKTGKNEGQAVAYLDDGTMIVVEGGIDSIGKSIDVNVTSVLQTSAGRMIFAKPV